eukprot:c15067_g1_i1.p1 GENE.c15067_g1_i1~~c15067_g1_i1.p1  ORF type:complete len:529 (+),score=99.96 c15067_g1_i1:51-1637(+)
MISALLVCVLILVVHPFLLDAAPPTVTYLAFLQYIEDLPGLLVVGRTLDDTRTPFAKTMIVDEHTVSKLDFALRMLSQEGWIIRYTSTISNYQRHRPKVSVFGMVEYDAVVTLDSALMLTTNIDEVFACGAFCAVERDNAFATSFMVIHPNATLDLQNQMLRHPEYSNLEMTEHIFLNTVLNRFDYMPMYEGNGKVPQFEVVGHKEYRLPNIYCGDVMLYYFRNSMWWENNGLPPKVLRFNVGAGISEPWNFYGYGFFSLHWTWYAVLKTILPPETVWITCFRVLIPIALGAVTLPYTNYVCYYINLAYQHRFVQPIYHLLARLTNNLLSFVGAFWLVGSLTLAFSLAPNIIDGVHPIACWLLAFEWFALFLCYFVFGLLYFSRSGHVQTAQHIPLMKFRGPTDEAVQKQVASVRTTDETESSAWHHESEIPSTRTELPTLCGLIALLGLCMGLDLPRHPSGLFPFAVSLFLYMFVLVVLVALLLYRLPVIFHDAYSGDESVNAVYARVGDDDVITDPEENLRTGETM